MKTSELKRILSEYCKNFKEDENAIYDVYWTLWKKEHRLVFHEIVPLDVLKVLGEYHNTPISEREDEKKYNLKYNDICFDFADSWLVQESDGKFWFSVFMKGKFTQSDIDNFPSEIKGAIECGFLRKVEVE